jgi:FHA domain
MTTQAPLQLREALPQPHEGEVELKGSPSILRQLVGELRELVPAPLGRQKLPDSDEHTIELSDPDGAPVVLADPLAVLDHRARSRTVSPRLAGRGHYLAFEGAAETRLLALETRITHLGRDVAADLRLEDQRISRDHAIIVRHGRFARVLDNRSSNGTFVNGRRIVATNIVDGDEIRIGPAVMRYVEVR